MKNKDIKTVQLYIFLIIEIFFTLNSKKNATNQGMTNEAK